MNLMHVEKLTCGIVSMMLDQEITEISARAIAEAARFSFGDSAEAEDTFVSAVTLLVLSGVLTLDDDKVTLRRGPYFDEAAKHAQVQRTVAAVQLHRNRKETVQ